MAGDDAPDRRSLGGGRGNGGGLIAMRQRAEMAGGEFLISSAPGEGTTVESWLPSHHQGAEPSYPSMPQAAGGDG